MKVLDGRLRLYDLHQIVVIEVSQGDAGSTNPLIIFGYCSGEIACPFLPLKRLAKSTRQAVPGRNKTVTERRMRSRVYQSGGRDERANERYSQAATGGSPD
jgi:hypothetical protein